MLPVRETQAKTAASDPGAGPAGTRQKAQDTCAGLRSQDVNPSCVDGARPHWQALLCAILWLLQIDRDHLLLDTPGSPQVIQMARLSVSAQTRNASRGLWHIWCLLEEQSYPLWTVSSSSQEFRHFFFLRTIIHPLL